ncbi:hypothetical protein GN956_G25648 [Arapaima gigas]
MRIATIVIVVTALVCISAASFKQVSSVVKGSVLLPCGTSHKGHEVKWMLYSGDLVAHYQQGKLTAGSGFESRVHLTKEMIESGNYSLIISPVEFSDGDLYRCFFDIPKAPELTTDVKLVVLEPTEVSTVVGAPTSLPCFTYVSRRADSSQVDVRWEKDGRDVLKLRSGSVLPGPGFKGRVTVFKDRIRHGDLSLVFNSTRASDSGTYRCFYNNKGQPNAVVLSVKDPSAGPSSPDLHPPPRRTDENQTCRILWILASVLIFLRPPAPISLSRYITRDPQGGVSKIASVAAVVMMTVTIIVTSWQTTVWSSTGAQISFEITFRMSGFSPLLIALLASLVCPTGSPLGPSPLRHVDAVLHEAATLLCEGTIDDSQMEVKWTLSTKEPVAQYHRGKLTPGPRYKNRVHLAKEGTGSGNGSLIISEVEYMDADLYSCVITSPPGREHRQDVRLQVLVPTKVSTVVGAPTSLPCFTYVSRRADSSQVDVRWEKDGRDVLKLRSGSVLPGPGFKGRVTVFKDRIRHGDLSLVFNSTSASDSGTYRCFYNNKGQPDVIVLSVKASDPNLSVPEDQSILLQFSSTESVKVEVFGSGGQRSGVSTCENLAKGPLLRCEVCHGASRQNSTVQLCNVSVSDSGVYRMTDSRTNNTIAVITVNFTGDQSNKVFFMAILLAVLYRFTEHGMMNISPCCRLMLILLLMAIPLGVYTYLMLKGRWLWFQEEILLGGILGMMIGLMLLVERKRIWRLICLGRNRLCRRQLNREPRVGLQSSTREGKQQLNVTLQEDLVIAEDKDSSEPLTTAPELPTGIQETDHSCRTHRHSEMRRCDRLFLQNLRLSVCN